MEKNQKMQRLKVHLRHYSMPPYICIQFPNLMTGVQNYYSNYYNCPYMSLFICVGVCVEQQVCVCICCLFLQVDRQLSCTLNFNQFTFTTHLFSHNALYAQPNTAHNIQQNTNTNSSQFTSSQFTLNKTKIPTASNINNTFS